MQQLLIWIELNQSLVYLLLFGYCALKSGALPLLAGVLVQQGALDLASVALATFLGGYLGDEIRFFVARRYGGALFVTKPTWREYLDRTKQAMERYGRIYIFLYRYPKGMRTIGAIPVGLSQMPWMEFTILNALSAVLWCGLLVGLGIILGEQLSQVAERWWGVASVVLLMAFIIASIVAFRRIAHLQQKAP
ncbi:MAG: DedA family protein [Pseudotabrizicola sp.]|jgi:membrane-associated protein|uniref:DedA family protein n=1 Tax=Pseudotabrizicola sp. TaxID=2939647 RepID=UPI00271F86CD|nr:DedA family protein [Pseudotabrizicola sp.]MDO9641146.1 DedA family protein [Pseudotabrizicola sp.]